eukprot:m.165128 g.165128  ORF g.165128 m.165128 type:complete len:78 (-) comp10322_c0_seq4:67-300(-)
MTRRLIAMFSSCWTLLQPMSLSQLFVTISRLVAIPPMMAWPSADVSNEPQAILLLLGPFQIGSCLILTVCFLCACFP